MRHLGWQVSKEAKQSKAKQSKASKQTSKQAGKQASNELAKINGLITTFIAFKAETINYHLHLNLVIKAQQCKGGPCGFCTTMDKYDRNKVLKQ